jgi:uncharacterized protein (TIGR01244 family)
MKMNRLNDSFAVTGQIRPEQIGEIAALGYKAIVCARPDNEEAGQPSFAEIEAAAKRHGVEAVHIPMLGGAPSPDQVARFRLAMNGVAGPALGYCRSGVRAGNLYAAASGP